MSGLLEPCAGKLACTVLRGRDDGNFIPLPDAELGAQVRKGEKASMVIFYKEYAVDADPDAADDTGMRRVARASSVFNVAQVDGFAPAELPELPPIEHLQRAEAVIAASRADIRHGGEMAFYRRPVADGSGDYIQMPDERRFQASSDAQRSEDYYSVLLHELTHYADVRIMPCWNAKMLSHSPFPESGPA